MDWQAITLGVGASVGTALVGYWMGRRQEIDRQRLARALPIAEEIAQAQRVHTTRVDLIRWFDENFSDIPSRSEAVRLFERHSIYDATRARVLDLRKLERELDAKLLVGRVYLNPRDMDRIAEDIQLANFGFSDDGIGGALYTDFWERFVDNLLDPQVRSQRTHLWLHMRRRFPKMHTLWQLRRGA